MEHSHSLHTLAARARGLLQLHSQFSFCSSVNLTRCRSVSRRQSRTRARAKDLPGRSFSGTFSSSCIGIRYHTALEAAGVCAESAESCHVAPQPAPFCTRRKRSSFPCRTRSSRPKLTAVWSLSETFLFPESIMRAAVRFPNRSGT